jgi:hypothetical protein
MILHIFKSKSEGKLIGYTHMRKNLAGWQFWIGNIFLTFWDGKE